MLQEKYRSNVSRNGADSGSRFQRLSHLRSMGANTEESECDAREEKRVGESTGASHEHYPTFAAYLDRLVLFEFIPHLGSGRAFSSQTARHFGSCPRARPTTTAAARPTTRAPPTRSEEKSPSSK